MSLLFTGIYILLASSLTYQLILRLLQEKARFLYLCSTWSLVLFGIHYIYTVTLPDHLTIFSAISTANLLFFAVVLGVGLCSAIKRIGELVPVSITAAIADIVSVYKGPTEEMVEDIASYYQEGMEGSPPFIDFIVIKVGIPGITIPMPLFGVTDWILIVLFSATLKHLQKHDNLLDGIPLCKATVYLPITVVGLYVGLVTAAMAEAFIPAMPFIVIFFLVYLFLKEKVHRYIQKIDIIYSLVFPSLVILVIYLAS